MNGNGRNNWVVTSLIAIIGFLIGGFVENMRGTAQLKIMEKRLHDHEITGAHSVMNERWVLHLEEERRQDERIKELEEKLK